MKRYKLNKLTEKSAKKLCRRPAIDRSELFRQVEPILLAVKERGDRALKEFTRNFDQVDSDQHFFSPEELQYTLSGEIKDAIDTAMQNVHTFHIEQREDTVEVETSPGILCTKQTRPIERVGIYIPGGTAPLPSTAIMLGTPAAAAGCETIVLATPPDKNGKIPDSIIYIARKIGAAGILIAGGAQAIAAMAWGTETVPKSDKIFGPGNQYVTAAKMLLQNSDAMVSIDLPAGPSELLVVADKTADPGFVAADLLSQAEHGRDSQVVLAASEGFQTDKMLGLLNSQIQNLSRSNSIKAALENSFILETQSIDEAIEFSNRYAPEHLILNVENAGSFVDKVRHAGSVFLGPNTPESLGDYASGTNHTLPTYGYARMYSGVTLGSFQKSITFQRATEDGLRNLGPVVEKLAELEGLDAHRRAVSIRLETLNESG